MPAPKRKVRHVWMAEPDAPRPAWAESRESLVGNRDVVRLTSTGRYVYVSMSRGFRFPTMRAALVGWAAHPEEQRERTYDWTSPNERNAP